MESMYYANSSSAIDEGARIGSGTRIWYFCHVMKGAVIGEDCNIGQNVFIDSNVIVGDRVKIQNNVSLYNGTVIEDDVFLGPAAVFTNVINPRAFIERKNEFRPTRIMQGATIGANATIVCGNTIGRYAMIGAGSAVTTDIPDYALVYGSPARIKGWVCKCGEKLEFENESKATCPQCGSKYLKDHNSFTVEEERNC